MEDFVKIELAIKLKELGFNIPFFFYYRTDDKQLYHLARSNPLVYGKDMIDSEVVIAPTIAQVLKWLRDKGIHITIEIVNSGWFCSVHRFGKKEDDLYDIINRYLFTGGGNDYEKAALAGIEYILDNLIMKQKNIGYGK